VARHLGTDHTAIDLSPGAALDVVPRLPDVYDEPFSDPSQLPTMAIAEVARGHVTVCLSGDGGDEVFGGYNRYTQGRRLWNLMAPVPRPVRRALARALLTAPPALLNRVLEPAKVQKLAALLELRSAEELHPALVSAWPDPDILVVGGRQPDTTVPDDELPPGLDDIADRMMFLDCRSTLPDEMLAKVDRASMAVSLETRVPLLDPRILEFAWALPSDMRIRDGQGKRPKAGFDPPIAEWLRGPLRPWAEELLEPSRLEREGYLTVEPIHRCWTEHVDGRRNWDYRLWAVLMFQAWLEQHSRHPPLPRHGHEAQ
jgi:asparagine synthase (glutamine-hydrolysing)